MFERFSEEGRQVIVCAQEEARSLQHSYIGTEHILLGVLREEERAGGEQPLHSLGLTLEDVRRDVRRIVGAGEEPSTGAIPFTPRAKKVLELSLREALSLGHNWIGPEHIVLGIVREDEGVASRIMLDFDADAEKVRERVTKMVAPRPPGHVVPHSGSQMIRLPVEAGWLGGLGRIVDQLGHEIRSEMGRDPDIGDLLLAIGCARSTVAGQALQELGVDLDALWASLERLRQHRRDEATARARRIDEVREQKRKALEAENYGEAGKLRDEERRLTEELGAGEGPDAEVLTEVRRRLGLPGRERPSAEAQ